MFSYAMKACLALVRPRTPPPPLVHAKQKKTAYRRLMLRVHPDKLASLELSEPWLAGARPASLLREGKIAMEKKEHMPKGLLKFVANKPYKFHVEVMMIVDKINLFSPRFFVVGPDDNTVHSDEVAMLQRSRMESPCACARHPPAFGLAQEGGI